MSRHGSVTLPVGDPEGQVDGLDDVVGSNRDPRVRRLHVRIGGPLVEDSPSNDGCWSAGSPFVVASAGAGGTAADGDVVSRRQPAFGGRASGSSRTATCCVASPLVAIRPASRRTFVMWCACRTFGAGPQCAVSRVLGAPSIRRCDVATCDPVTGRLEAALALLNEAAMSMAASSDAPERSANRCRCISLPLWCRARRGSLGRSRRRRRRYHAARPRRAANSAAHGGR